MIYFWHNLMNLQTAFAWAASDIEPSSSNPSM